MSDRFIDDFRHRLQSDLSPQASGDVVTEAVNHETPTVVSPEVQAAIHDATRQALQEALGTLTSKTEDSGFAMARAVLAVGANTAPAAAPAVIYSGERRSGNGFKLIAAAGLVGILLFSTDQGRDIIANIKTSTEEGVEAAPTTTMRSPTSQFAIQEGAPLAETCNVPVGEAPLLKAGDGVFIVPPEEEQTLIKWNVLTETPDGMRYTIEIQIPAATGLGVLTDEVVTQLLGSQEFTDEELLVTLANGCAIAKDKTGYFLELVGTNHSNVMRVVEKQG